MKYQVFTMAGTVRVYTEVRSQCKIPYIPAGQMKKRYPDKDFVIIGEIGSLARAPTDGDWLCLKDGKTIPIHPRGSLKRPLEWVTGYTAVDESSYVALIGGFLHFIMTLRLTVKMKR